LIFRRGLTEEDLIEVEIDVKNIAETFRKRALEHRKQYESVKEEIIKDIKSGVNIDNPTLIVKAKRALYHRNNAVEFYNDYNNLLLLVEEIKNMKVRVEAMRALRESDIVNILKNKLQPRLKQAVGDANSFKALVERLLRYSSEAKPPEVSESASEEEVSAFLKSLALQTSAEATATEKPTEASLKDVLEKLEKDLSSIR